MNSINKVSELIDKKAEIMLGGGKEKQDKQRQDGSMTARERIDALLDNGSFVEIGAFVSARNENTPADGVITGYGTIDERLVYVYSQDVTVMGGAMGEMYAAKVCKIMDMAAKMGAPVIGMLDSNGVRLNEGAMAQSAMGKVLCAAASISGVVPNISIVFGNCTGGSAIAAAMSDFVIMNEKNGKLFVNSPEVCEATEKKVPMVDAKGSVNESGNAHLIGADDAACVAIAQLLLSYLPSNNLSDAFMMETNDDLNRVTDSLNDVDAINDTRVIIAEIADDKAYFEIQADYAKNVSVGFVRLNGATVGVLANNDGELDGRGIQKLARFVRFCDCFNIPVLTITDAEGFKVSAAEENWGLVRKGAELACAFCEATVAKVNLIVNKAYGTAGVLLNSKEAGADIVLAYPMAKMLPLAPGAGVSMLMKEEFKNGMSREDAEKEYEDVRASIYNAAALGCVDDIILPEQTRARVIAAFEMLKSKRACAPVRKHDNMPL